MPGKCTGRAPPRSANELGCQANGGARAGHVDPPCERIERNKSVN